MTAINYNSPESQIGFQVKNLLEDRKTALLFPNRYWMTLSIDSTTESKWEAQCILNETKIVDIWEQKIQEYFNEIASISHSNLICIWGVDNLRAFHSVVLSNQSIYEDCWLKEWPFARKSWWNRADGKRVEGKQVKTYNSDRNAVPYIFHHHDPSVSYVRHRRRSNRNNPPVVNAIEKLIQGMALPSTDTSMVKSESSAPTSIVSEIKSHK